MVRKLLLLLVIFAPACASPTPSPAPSEKPDIILITLDTTRADRMGFLGSKSGLTPNLDALARQGVVFSQAYAQAPITTVSHATILTGTFPPYHGVHDFSEPLPNDVPSLADSLRKQGYRTAAFVGALILDPVNGMAPNFNRGFDVYDAGYRLRRGRQDDRYQTLERRAEEVVRRAREWLNQKPAGPFFLWVHLFDAHEPYEAPGEYGSRHSKAPYDGEIAYADAELGKLFQDLQGRNLFGNSVIAVAADHGEAFGEHGEFTHGVFLYDSTIHVPLVMKFQEGHWAGQSYAGRVCLADIAPTILAASSVPVPKEMQGQNLLTLLGRGAIDRPAYSETRYTRRAFGWSSLAALRTESFLFIEAPRAELYDTAADPGTERDVAKSRAADAQRLSRQLNAFRKNVSQNRAPASGKQPPADPRLAEKLAALGYVAGPATDKPDKDLADPKDKIQVANQLHQATLLVEQERPAEAIPILNRILSGDPQIFVAQVQLGLAQLKQKNYRAALGPLRKATDLMPASGPAQYAYARALLFTGNSVEAALHLEIVIEKNPQWAGAHFMLGTAYATSNRPEKAIEQLRVANSLDAQQYGTNLVLGRLLAAQGNVAEGLPYLEKASALRPDSAEAHRFLGLAYEQLGRIGDAAREKSLAAQLRSSPSTVPPEP